MKGPKIEYKIAQCPTCGGNGVEVRLGGIHTNFSSTVFQCMQESCKKHWIDRKRLQYSLYLLLIDAAIELGFDGGGNEREVMPGD